jgi:predicted ATPase
MDPQVRRRRALEAIKRIVLRESLSQPLIVIFEDLHWIDSETQALLDLLAESIISARELLLVNYRPEYRHEWSGRGHILQLRLDPLGTENAAAMLGALLGEGAELEALERLIAQRSGGVSSYPDINTFTGTCMSGGNASSQGDLAQAVVPTPLPPCAGAICNATPTPGPSPIP